MASPRGIALGYELSGVNILPPPPGYFLLLPMFWQKQQRLVGGSCSVFLVAGGGLLYQEPVTRSSWLASYLVTQIFFNSDSILHKQYAYNIGIQCTNINDMPSSI